MPELPDLTVYLDCLRLRVLEHELTAVRMLNPFVLRTVEPPVRDLVGRKVVSLGLIGKRIVFGFDDDLFLVIHLMISGRLRWFEGPPKGVGKIGHALFSFGEGTLGLTEASSKKRASVGVYAGRSQLQGLDPGGVDPLTCSFEEFFGRLRAENHTVKRVLTDPKCFAGIGNAYSDEILLYAKLSPIKLTASISEEEGRRLYEAMRRTLEAAIAGLREHFRNGEKFPGPGEVTAFRPEHAVHGKFGQPCPVCGKPVQRIVYAENETNYCAQCQTGGRVLADRALSRLLKTDWPRTLDD